METAAELVQRPRKTRPRVRGKKGAIIRAYVRPPARTRVICIDELGPIAAKMFPGEEWKLGPYRATFQPDYGRRGSIWLHGAFEPATGLATILCSSARDGASHIQLLEEMITVFPSDRWLIIEDNLTIHKSRDVRTALLAWPEIRIQFIPKYACWLNLIEPWWKQLKALALKGRRFETVDELVDAFCNSLEYWNAHRHPYIWQKVPDVWPKHVLGGFGYSKHK